MDKLVMINRTQERLLTVTVRSIYWERVNLYLKIDVTAHEGTVFPDELDFYLVNEKHEAKARFKAEDRAQDHALLLLQITNPGNCLCMPEGRYQCYACRGNEILAAAAIDSDLASSLLDVDRAFQYSAGHCSHSYTVSFSVGENEDDLRLIVQILDMVQSHIPRRIACRNAAVNLIKKMLSAYYAVSHRWYRFFSSRKRKKTILFLSEQTFEPSATMRVLYERMLQRGIDKEFNILFSLQKGEIWRSGPKYCLGALRKMARADQIYVDDRFSVFSWLTVAADTQLVQLWHAGAGYKSSGLSRLGSQNSPSPYGAHRQYDYGITPSAKIASFFSEVFGINTEQILPTGMPRTDEFLSAEHREEKTKELYESFPAIRGKKVILFAPTFRGHDQNDACYPYGMIDFDALYSFCGEEYVVWFKMHPWVSEPVPIAEKYSDRFFDMSKYPSINDLFYVTDILIGDYSSNVFEFSLMSRPMLFYAFDEARYSVVRGFHRDYRSSIPGKLCQSFEELLQALKDEDYELDKLTQYRARHIDVIDTGASDRVIDWIVLGKLPGEYAQRIACAKADYEKTASADFSCLDDLTDKGPDTGRC